jgi:D-glycero-alpha-D-manno-heptose-7-phosphate kinase
MPREDMPRWNDAADARMATKESMMTIFRARAPLRISFAGGGTDVSPYREERGGAVLCATVNRWVHATLIPGGDRLSVESVDYDVSVSYELDQEMVFDGQLDVAKAALAYFRREYGFQEGLTVRLHSGAPPGSGLGSSSAMVVALTGVLAAHLNINMDPYMVAETATVIEREEAGIKGGQQDQYAIAFGGFNFIEFEHGRAVVDPLRLRIETTYELEYGLAFAYVGGQSSWDDIIDRQVENFVQRRPDAVAAMDRTKELAYAMKRALLLGDIPAFGSLLDEAWLAKKRMADGITTPRIDAVYDAAKRAGALGGKLSGAGGGGFMFFVVDPESRFAVQDALKNQGADVVSLSFAEEGMKAWAV